MNMPESSMDRIARLAPTASPRSIGAILIDAGRLSIFDAEQILRRQKEQGNRFGDAGIALGLLDDEDIRFALASQFDYPCLPANDTRLSGELIAAYTPSSAVVEQMRALRSQLLLRWLDAESRHKALAIVSPRRGEGRSFIAANLAVVFSQLGERTLLIDADLRTPRQHHLFKLGERTGLSGLLSGRGNLDAVIRIPSLQGLSVLPAGIAPPNPQELLGRRVFIETLNTLGRNYDIILLDTPAACDCADAQTVAALAGSALMLARNDHSSINEVAELASSLRQSGTLLAGSVLNGTRASR